MHPSVRPLFRAVLALSLALLAARAFGQSITGTVGAGTYPGYTGIAVLDAGGTPQPFTVETGYTLHNNSFASASVPVRVGFTLLDADGVAVAPESFSTRTTHLVPGNFTVTGTKSAVVAPPALTSGAPYRIRTRLYRERTGFPGVYDPLGLPRTSAPFRFEVVAADAEPGTVAWIRTQTLQRDFTVAGIAGLESFPVRVTGIVGRLAELALPVADGNVVLHVDFALSGAAAGPIALNQARQSMPLVLANHTAGGAPVSVAFDETIVLEPGAQLDPTDTYTLTLSLAVTEPDATEHPADPGTPLDALRLLQFNGTLRFGAVTTQLLLLDGTDGALGAADGGGELTTLYVAEGGITLSSVTGYTAGAPGGLAVALRPDGTADALAPVTWTAAPGAENGVAQGVRYRRGTVTLGETGFNAAQLFVQFPAGLSLVTDPEIRRHRATHPLANVPLDDTLTPIGPLALTPADIGAAALYVSHEDLPLLFTTSQINWEVGAGTFEVVRDDTRYTQAAELDRLDVVRPILAASEQAFRFSNEQYYRRPTAGAASALLFRADAAGRANVAEARIELLPGAFFAHFPVPARVAWTGAGFVQWRDGVVVPAESALESPAAFPIVYTTNCGGPACPVGAPAIPPSLVQFTPSAPWTFTVDGGLRTSGEIAAAPLHWGARSATSFAHETEPFTDARVLVAGHVLHGVFATTANDLGAGALLHAGHSAPGDDTLIERPGTAGYALGFADYPGINFRVGTDGAKFATSILGDKELGPYELRGTSKYYLRTTGLSGIHEAVTASFTALLGGLEIHQFPMSLSGLQLSYLDNRNRDSLIAGEVSVPGARGTTGFSQTFTQLALRCTGELGELTLPNPNDEVHALSYWQARFKAHRAEFIPKGLAPCPGPEAVLVFGAEVQLPAVVKESLAGGLGFFPNGNLVPASAGYFGVDSRLRRPARLNLHGTRSAGDPSRPGFTVNPMTDLYFNDALAGGAPDDGFVSFAGTVDVPFFEDLRVHVLARATGGPTVVRGGWSEGTATFFNSKNFDAANRGFPAGDFADYLANPAFAPVARKNWLGFVDFALPVFWEPARREFRGADAIKKPFLVIETKQVLERLTPTAADLRFGAQFTGLPRLNPAALVIDEDEAINELLQHLPAGSDLVNAAKTLEALLAGRSDQLIDRAIDTQVDAFLAAAVDPLLASLESASDARDEIAGNAPALGAALQAQLSGLVGSAGSANTILKEVDDGLLKLDAGLAAADLLLRKGGNGAFQLLPDGPRGQVLASATAIAGAGAGGFDLAAEINGPLKGTLDEVHGQVVALHGAIGSTRSTLGSVQAGVQAALDVANGAGGIGAISVEAMRKYFETASGTDTTGRFLLEAGATPADSRAKIHGELRRCVRDAVHASSFVRDLRASLFDLLEPLRDDYRTAFDRVNATINDLVRNALASATSSLATQLQIDGGLNQSAGDFSNALQLARLDGTAHIDGDTLTHAHVGAELGLHIPDAFRISGWLDYRNYKSGQPDLDGVIVPADGRIEVILHAEGAAKLSGNPAIQATLEGRYAMTSGGKPLAVGGLLDFASELHFDAFSLKNVHLEFSFGDRDNYVYGRGQGGAWFIDCDVRVFMGRTSNIELLKRIDPDLVTLLDKWGLAHPDRDHPLTGIYWNGDGEGSLNRFFGIPDTPLLTLKGLGGEGTFAFTNQTELEFSLPPPGTNLILGKRTRKGIDVQLGLAGASAEFVVLGAIDAIELLTKDSLADVGGTIFENGGLFSGAITGRFTPRFSLGVEPFEISWSKDFRFTAKGAITPPPLAPPPGLIWLNDLEFD